MSARLNGDREEFLSDEEIERILFAESEVNLPESADVPPLQLTQDHTHSGLGVIGKIIYLGLVLIVALPFLL